MKGPITLSISKASFPYVHFKVSQEREEVIQLQGEGARTGQLMTKPKLSFLKKKKKRLQMLEVCKLALFMTTESEQLREQYDD